ncbi:hypothetical protein A0H81_12733 [Grifola frondosa]|uniref:Uncharacterized protein n=1 Tax=Grifola frondosa TaxID=5627 RepID=A0A1C7LT82_GRIFR|nr:hypothetical protein A0H81_12733 [Grifola frondosa]
MLSYSICPSFSLHLSSILGFCGVVRTHAGATEIHRTTDDAMPWMLVALVIEAGKYCCAICEGRPGTHSVPRRLLGLIEKYTVRNGDAKSKLGYIDSVRRGSKTSLWRPCVCSRGRAASGVGGRARGNLDEAATLEKFGEI